jgi:hypothetical protein
MAVDEEFLARVDLFELFNILGLVTRALHMLVQLANLVRYLFILKVGRLQQRKFGRLVKNTATNFRVAHMVLLVAQIFNGGTEDLLFDPSVEVTESKDVRIDLLDVFLDQETAVTPTENTLWDKFLELELAAIVAQDIPMHDFQKLTLARNFKLLLRAKGFLNVYSFLRLPGHVRLY